MGLFAESMVALLEVGRFVDALFALVAGDGLVGSLDLGGLSCFDQLGDGLDCKALPLMQFFYLEIASGGSLSAKISIVAK
ncbi:hypothetical protein AXFE_29720 [Acidithrix ferrooxidans]|uniref:Uncharacterized protein n=1 Tax=Acidithrix ferrooxidans TaxID=1280514 RepID=A0A0D8HGF8_9ACTN|nr:hypothetical protein AXFE_29720 [Acidithrix ferrooxidans]